VRTERCTALDADLEWLTLREVAYGPVGPWAARVM